MCNWLFYFIDQCCTVSEVRNTHCVEPVKYAWLRVQIGMSPQDAPSLQTILKSYYDFACIPYRLETDFYGNQAAVLDAQGFLHLHVFEAIADPNEAFDDWTRYLSLLDSRASGLFPKPLPRSCLPAFGDLALKRSLDAFKYQAARAMDWERKVAESQRTIARPSSPYGAANSSWYDTSYWTNNGGSSNGGERLWGQIEEIAKQAVLETSKTDAYGALSDEERALQGLSTLTVSNCRCSQSAGAPDNSSSMPTFLDGLRKVNPGVQEIQTRLEEREKQFWARTKELAKDAGVDLLSPRPVTISSDQANSRGAVQLQAKYAGVAPVMRSSIADLPCEGVQALLTQFNDLLRTTYTLDHPGLRQHLQKCIDSQYDIGTAYGCLRPYWFGKFEELQARLEVAEKEDRAMRVSALVDTKVVNASIPPRRFWDLYSNRVLPWWIPGAWEGRLPWAISHSWFKKPEQQEVITQINGKEWPVPIPQDTNLERLRIELLNYGAEYVWLDVLCLRQEAPGEEAAKVRAQECMLDVPTIGNVYRNNEHIVTYFSGLGRPFGISNLKSERRWLKRAWTLQEASCNVFVGGLVSREGDLGFDASGKFSSTLIEQFYTTLEIHSRHARWRPDEENVFPLLDCMRGRASTHEADKISGLAYLLQSKILPAYQEDVDSEDAWNHLLETVNPPFRGDLIFLHPVPGDKRMTWRPSWKQIKEDRLPQAKDVKLYEAMSYNSKDETCSYSGYVLEVCTIEGLDEVDWRGYCREGKVKVSHEGLEYIFSVTAHHQQRIPRGAYTLVGNKGDSPGQGWDPSHMYWVIAEREVIQAEEGPTRVGEGPTPADEGSYRLKKVSVLRMESEEDRDKLQGLGVAEEITVIFA